VVAVAADTAAAEIAAAVADMVAVVADTATNAAAVVEMAADGAADANRPKIEDFGCQDCLG
jgi:hypothetical protein